MKNAAVRSQRKNTRCHRWQVFEGAALCSQFPGNDSQSGLAHTHTHTVAEHLTNIMQPTSIAALAQEEGILAIICLCSEGMRVKRRRAGQPPLNLVSLFMCRSVMMTLGSRWSPPKLRVEFFSPQSPFWRRPYCSTKEVTGLWVCCLYPHMKHSSLSLTLTVTCSTPPLSPEPTHRLHWHSHTVVTLLDNRYSHKPRHPQILHGPSKLCAGRSILTPVWLWPSCLMTSLFFFSSFSSSN